MKATKIMLLAALLAFIPLVAVLAKVDPPVQEKIEKPVDSQGGGETDISEMSILKIVELDVENLEPEVQDEIVQAVEEDIKDLFDKIDKIIFLVKDRRIYEYFDMTTGKVRPPCVFPDLMAEPVSEIIKAQLGIKGGLAITGLKGMFLKSGLEQYDIITKINGKAINSVNDLNKALKAAPADKESKIEIIRGGEEDVVNVTLPKVPAPDKPIIKPMPRPRPWPRPRPGK